MGRLFIFAAIGALIYGNVIEGSENSDHGWVSINCHKIELVLGNTSNNTSEEVLLQAQGSIDPDEPGSGKEQCFAIRKKSKDDLEFDNYGVSVSMLHVRSKNNPENIGNFGLIFNYEDEFNYDYVYLSSNTTKPIKTTTVLPPAVQESSTITTTIIPPPTHPQLQESEKVYFFQAGNRFNGEFADTASIILNGSVSENVWHRLALVIDKDSNSTVEIFFDDGYIGSSRENLAPRDVGGVMSLDLYENVAVFKDFKIGRCSRFNSIGQCIEPLNNCPEWYTLVGEKCFLISNSTETYINSIAECGIKGGKLYEPRDAVTYMALVEYLKNKLGYYATTRYHTWLAVSDRKEEGTFVYESDGATLEYENWQSGYGVHRGVYDTRYDCAYMFQSRTYTWYTMYCNQAHYRKRYICETLE